MNLLGKILVIYLILVLLLQGLGAFTIDLFYILWILFLIGFFIWGLEIFGVITFVQYNIKPGNRQPWVGETV